MRQETSTTAAITRSGRARAPSAPSPAPRLRRGTTLVELLVAMLILALVCIAWLQIIGIQSARREARRREAVERLAGMMDAFMYNYRTKSGLTPNRFYQMVETDRELTFRLSDNESRIFPMFDTDVSPIGYRLCYIAKTRFAAVGLPDQKYFEHWDANATGRGAAPPNWVVGMLYDRNGMRNEGDKPFFMLPVCMGF